MFVSIKNEESRREYKNILSVLENDNEYQQLIDRAEKDFISYKDRWNDLIELKDLKNIVYKNI